MVFEKVHHFINNKKKHLDRIDFVKGPQMRFFSWRQLLEGVFRKDHRSGMLR